MAEIADIVTRLLQRTNQQNISWQPTVSEDVFLATIGDSSSVTVNGYKTGRGQEEVRFRILDERGRKLEEYDTYDMDDEFVRLKLIDIYEGARRFALQIDSHLDELLKDLENDQEYSS